MHEWRKQETSCWKQLKPNYKIIIYWYSNKRKKKKIVHHAAFDLQKDIQNYWQNTEKSSVE